MRSYFAFENVENRRERFLMNDRCVMFEIGDDSRLNVVALSFTVEISSVEDLSSLFLHLLQRLLIHAHGLFRVQRSVENVFFEWFTDARLDLFVRPAKTRENFLVDALLHDLLETNKRVRRRRDETNNSYQTSCRCAPLTSRSDRGEEDRRDR